MARKSRAPAKIQKAIRQLQYSIPSGVSYVDIFKDLSMVNRKLFKQGHVLGIESVEFVYTADPAQYPVTRLQAFTAGDSWSVHNAHVKSKALWDEMNQLVLEDNPSIQAKWHDFKVYLDDAMATATILNPKDGAGADVVAGEWSYSRFVLPEHEVDPVTGLPLPADETFAHLVGPDVLDPVTGEYISVGMVQAYADSRAQVFDNAPNVPGAFSESFFQQLTDTGSQEPELGDVLEASNDDPPYPVFRYVGGKDNAEMPMLTEFAVATEGYPTATLAPFMAQCGLIKFENQSFQGGAQVAGPAITAIVTVMAGKYKGVAAKPMGQ
ncbi:MAG: hypothetical protein [Circular genetic element sp.]|nr:MAG: hypothetical protein [Circular genetic element sp.]